MNKKYLIGGLAIAAVLIIAVVTIAMHGSPSSSSMATGAGSSVMTNQISIKNYMFSPMAATVTVGTTVTWTNDDTVNHTVTADTNSTNAPSSMDIAHGKSYSFTFKKAGTYTYHCFPHPYMHGTITVTE